jgi:hypothetical protein
LSGGTSIGGKKVVANMTVDARLEGVDASPMFQIVVAAAEIAGKGLGIGQGAFLCSWSSQQNFKIGRMPRGVPPRASLAPVQSERTYSHVIRRWSASVEAAWGHVVL